MSSQWKLPAKEPRKRREKPTKRPRFGPPTGTEHYQRTAGMVACGAGSKVWWDPKLLGTYVA